MRPAHAALVAGTRGHRSLAGLGRRKAVAAAGRVTGRGSGRRTGCNRLVEGRRGLVADMANALAMELRNRPGDVYKSLLFTEWDIAMRSPVAGGTGSGGRLGCTDRAAVDRRIVDHAGHTATAAAVEDSLG
jgi:hypothetical protein